MRVKDKVAVVVGGGQTPGETIGNGRAAALLYAREGARLLVVDRSLDSASETCEMIRSEGGIAEPFGADITVNADCEGFTQAALDTYGRIDILHNNVGAGEGDGTIVNVEEEVWRKIIDINLTGTYLSCKNVVPVMREQKSGSIINISSVAAILAAPIAAYKSAKAGMNALSHSMVLGCAKHGIRINVIMPGFIDTPIAIEGRAKSGLSRDVVRAERDAQVPLAGGMGTAWDVAHAALFLASDEAKFITGVCLPVDGGQSARRG